MLNNSNLSKKIAFLFKNRQLQNGMWLYFLQFINTIVPLITLPYIIKIFGSERYGVISISLNIIGYLLVVINYGFELTGARSIAISKDKNQVQNVFTSITWTKLFILLLALCSVVAISYSSRFSLYERNIFYLLSLVLIGSAFSYDWLFHGLQKMKFITIINTISRTLSLYFIFTFVKTPTDIYIYVFIFSMIPFLNSVISFIIIYKVIDIRLGKPVLSGIYNQLREGFHVFITAMMGKIFSSFSLTVLVFFASKSEIGMFSALQKIPLIILMIFMPISQVMFPYFSKKFSENANDAFYVMKRVATYVILVFVVLSTLVVLASDFIIVLLFGSEYVEFKLILIPLMIWVVLSIANNFLGIQTLVANGLQLVYSKIFTMSLFFMIVINVTLGYFFNLIGVSIATLLSELFLMITLAIKVRKVKNQILIKSLC